jgi:hypothetical protein
VDVRIHGLATFLRLPKLTEVFDRIPHDRIVHLHIDGLYYIDHTCFEMLKSAASQRAAQGGAIEAPWEKLEHRFHLREGGSSDLQMQGRRFDIVADSFYADLKDR